MKQHLDETSILQEHPRFNCPYGARPRPTRNISATSAATGISAQGALPIPQPSNSDLSWHAPPTASASLVHPNNANISQRTSAWDHDVQGNSFNLNCAFRATSLVQTFTFVHEQLVTTINVLVTTMSIIPPPHQL